MRRRSEQLLSKGPVREPVDSFADTPTNLITLSPEFLRALRQVAPPPRPRKLRYALALVALGSMAWVSGQRLHFPHGAVAQGAPPPASSVAEVKWHGPPAEASASPSGPSSSAAAATHGPIAIAATSASIAPTRVQDLPRRPAPRPPTKPRAK